MTVAAAILFITANTAGQATLGENAVRDYARIVQAEAERFDLDPLLLVALIEVESDWRPRAVSPNTGAEGLGQLLPHTDATKGFDDYDITDPRVNIFLTARRLRRFVDLCRGDIWRAADGYNGRGVRRRKLSPYALEVKRRYESIEQQEVAAKQP